MPTMCNPCICCTTQNPWYLRGSVTAFLMIVFNFTVLGAMLAPWIWTDKTEMGLFRVCTWVEDPDGKCGPTYYSGCKTLEDYIKATRAFYILTLIGGVVVLVLGVLNAIAKINCVPVLVTGSITLFFGFIAWALGIFAYFKDFCGYQFSEVKLLGEGETASFPMMPGFGSDLTDSYKIGPATPVLIAGWAVGLIAMIVNCTVPSHPTDNFSHSRPVQHRLDEIDNEKKRNKAQQADL